MLTDDKIKELKEMVSRIPHPEGAVVEVMHEVQKAYGYLSDEALLQVSDIVGMPPARVDGLATFYNLIYRRPVGRKVIHVCDSISCWVVGMEDLLGYLKAKLGVELGGTTTDGAFTLLPICCIGACHEAPAMLVGDRIYGSLTREKIDEILDKERTN
jgi:NADH-quinone oxidoreductase subunit E